MSPSPALAACANPVGVAGETRFNADYNMLQYCDDTNWIPMYFNDYWANAVGFTGNAYMSGNLTGVANSKKFTLSAWFRRPASGHRGAVLDTNLSDSSDFQIDFVPSERLRLSATNAGGSTVLNLVIHSTDSGTYSGEFIANKWYHLLLSVDMDDPSATRAYINGTARTGGNFNFNTFSTGSTLRFPVTPFYIGIQQAGGGAGYFNGEMADFWLDFGTHLDLSDAAIRAKFIDARGKPVSLGANGERVTGLRPEIFLSGATASWHTNKGTAGGFGGSRTAATTHPGSHPDISSTNLVGHWKLDSTSGTTAVDSSGSGNNGTLVNGPVWTAGKYGNALNFTAASLQRVNMTDFFYSDVMTICAWTKQNSLGTSRSIVIKRNLSDGFTSQDNEFWLRANSTGSFTYIIFNNNTNGALDLTSPPQSAAVGKWIHVCAVQRGNGNTGELYVNGASVASATQTGTMQNTTSIVQLAARTNNDDTRYFDGIIDDVRIYTRALSDAEIRRLADRCLNPPGQAGTMIYNTDAHVMQFCDGRHWLAMGPPGDGGAGCSNPPGAAGEMVYNTDWKTMQYCEGDAWIGVGKGCRDVQGAMCEDGTLYAGISPSGGRMYITPCDAGRSWNGSSCTGTLVRHYWTNNNSNTNVRWITGIDNTNGKSNTAALTNGVENGTGDSKSDPGVQEHNAAKYCAELVAHGHDDWFLPARNELLAMTPKAAVMNFANIWYWSSSQYSTVSGYSVNVPAGTDWNPNKNNGPTGVAINLRCARK